MANFRGYYGKTKTLKDQEIKFQQRLEKHTSSQKPVKPVAGIYGMAYLGSDHECVREVLSKRLESKIMTKERYLRVHRTRGKHFFHAIREVTNYAMNPELREEMLSTLRREDSEIEKQRMEFFAAMGLRYFNMIQTYRQKRRKKMTSEDAFRIAQRKQGLSAEFRKNWQCSDLPLFFGKCIRNEILTQHIADFCGVGRSTVSRWANGVQIIRKKHIKKLIVMDRLIDLIFDPLKRRFGAVPPDSLLDNNEVPPYCSAKEVLWEAWSALMEAEGDRLFASMVDFDEKMFADTEEMMGRELSMEEVRVLALEKKREINERYKANKIRFRKRLASSSVNEVK